MSDAREKAIEAMADAFDNVAVIHHEYGENLYVENTEVGIAAALDALLAVLPTLGVRVVPDASNMTDPQVKAIAGMGFVLRGIAYDIYRVALAAAPNPLAETAGE